MRELIRKLIYGNNEVEHHAVVNEDETARTETLNEDSAVLPDGVEALDDVEETGLPAAVTEREDAEDKATEKVDPLQTAPLGSLSEESTPFPPPRLGPRTTGTTPFSSHLQAVRLSSVGAVRNRNEDACFSFVSETGGYAPIPPFGLFVVSDGMGGHFDGHIASKLVSRTVAHYVLRELYLPLLEEDAPGARRPIQEIMEEAVSRANVAIRPSEPDKEMGTTLTAVLILGNRMFVVHVGDSRAYLLQEGKLESLTRDHSVVQALQDAGQLTAEEAALHPNRNLLYRAIIGAELEQVDSFTKVLPERGMLLLCSDGLWGLVPDGEMKEILEGDGSLSEKTDKLVARAMKAGGHDNITVVLVEFQL